MNSATINKCVERVRHRFHSSKPEKIAEALGIFIRYDDIGCLKGLYTISNTFRYILINDSLDEYMTQVVLAHELGHDILHRDLAEVPGTVFREFSLYDLTASPEREANFFAADLLIDDNDVVELASLGYSTEEVARQLYVPHEFLLIKLIAMNGRGFSFKLPYIPRASFLK